MEGMYFPDGKQAVTEQEVAAAAQAWEQLVAVEEDTTEFVPLSAADHRRKILTF